jgi:hypothetical protein
MSQVFFKYNKGGAVRPMQEREAKILTKLKIGTYQTRDMVAGRPVYEQTAVVAPAGSIVSEASQSAAAELIDAEELDEHGTVWDPEIHAESKVKNKDGSWRKKPGGAKSTD